MAALNFVVDRLADIVQETGALGQGNVHAELSGEQAGDLGDLDGVVEHVLTVARAESQTAEELDEIGLQPVDVVSNRRSRPLP